jgi:hypothetical protein
MTSENGIMSRPGNPVELGNLAESWILLLKLSFAQKIKPARQLSRCRLGLYDFGYITKSVQCGQYLLGIQTIE